MCLREINDTLFIPTMFFRSERPHSVSSVVVPGGRPVTITNVDHDNVAGCHLIRWDFLLGMRVDACQVPEFIGVESAGEKAVLVVVLIIAFLIALVQDARHELKKKGGAPRVLDKIGHQAFGNVVVDRHYSHILVLPDAFAVLHVLSSFHAFFDFLNDFFTDGLAKIALSVGEDTNASILQTVSNCVVTTIATGAGSLSSTGAIHGVLGSR